MALARGSRASFSISDSPARVLTKLRSLLDEQIVETTPVGHRHSPCPGAPAALCERLAPRLDVPVGSDDLAAGRLERSLAGGELAGDRE